MKVALTNAIAITLALIITNELSKEDLEIISISLRGLDSSCHSGIQLCNKVVDDSDIQGQIASGKIKMHMVQGGMNCKQKWCQNILLGGFPSSVKPTMKYLA